MNISHLGLAELLKLSRFAIYLSNLTKRNLHVYYWNQA